MPIGPLQGLRVWPAVAVQPSFRKWHELDFPEVTRLQLVALGKALDPKKPRTLEEALALKPGQSAVHVDEGDEIGSVVFRDGYLWLEGRPRKMLTWYKIQIHPGSGTVVGYPQDAWGRGAVSHLGTVMDRAAQLVEAAYHQAIPLELEQSWLGDVAKVPATKRVLTLLGDSKGALHPPGGTAHNRPQRFPVAAQSAKPPKPD